MTTIVNEHGAPVLTIQGTEEIIALNTPPGGVAVEDPPEREMLYDHALKSWLPIPPSPGEGFVFDYPARQWVDTRSMTDVREAAWNKIKMQRDQLEFGGFEYNGNVYDSDQVSQGRILGAVNLGIDQVWTLADNSTVYLSSDELVDLYAALQEHISNLHERSRVAREKIENAQTIEEVESVTL